MHVLASCCLIVSGGCHDALFIYKFWFLMMNETVGCYCRFVLPKCIMESIWCELLLICSWCFDSGDGALEKHLLYDNKRKLIVLCRISRCASNSAACVTALRGVVVMSYCVPVCVCDKVNRSLRLGIDMKPLKLRGTVQCVNTWIQDMWWWGLGKHDTSICDEWLFAFF